MWALLVDSVLMEVNHLGFNSEGARVDAGFCSAIRCLLFWTCVFLRRLRYVINCYMIFKLADYIWTVKYHER